MTKRVSRLRGEWPTELGPLLDEKVGPAAPRSEEQLRSLVQGALRRSGVSLLAEGSAAAERGTPPDQQAPAEQGLPEQGFPQQGLPQQAPAEQGFPEQGFPEQGLSQQGLSQQGLPQQRAGGGAKVLRLSRAALVASGLAAVVTAAAAGFGVYRALERSAPEAPPAVASATASRAIASFQARNSAPRMTAPPPPPTLTIEQAPEESATLAEPLPEPDAPLSAKPQSQPAPAEDLLARASGLRAERRYAEALRVYLSLIRKHPQSPQAQVARVSAAALRLEHLGDHAGARELFESAARRGGGLSAEAEFGVAEAHRAAGNRGAERAALRRFVHRHPESPLARLATRRLTELGQPEPAQPEPAQPEPAQPEPAHPQPAQPEPAQP